MARRGGRGPMQFGTSRIGWGASASPAAYAMGRAYGSVPRSRQAGTRTGGPGYRRILNPWGNNIPSPSGMGLAGIGRSNFRQGRLRPGRRMPTQAPDEIRIDYPANDPRMWPIEGGKRILLFQAAKANWNNTVVNHAFVRAGYPQVNSPVFSGTDQQYAEATTVTTVSLPPGATPYG